MDLIFQFLLAILPIIVIFAGLVFFHQSGTLMGVVGLALTIAIAVVFFQTSRRLPCMPLQAVSSPPLGSP